MDKELIALSSDIRDLKTAQLRPSIMKMYEKQFTIPTNITRGFHYWTIHFQPSDNPTKPIAFDNYFLFVLEAYDSGTNTQKIVIDIPYDGTYGGDTYSICSTQPISSITMDS